MKTLIAGVIILAPVLALAQPMASSYDEPAKPKPIQPIVASEHEGPGRIGVRLAFQKETGLPQIVGMVRGGPAADYGFQIGDVIVKIDKNFTNSLSQDEIKTALHGEPGTGVELTVQRGDDPRLVVRAIQRRVISQYAEDIVTPALIDGHPMAQ